MSDERRAEIEAGLAEEVAWAINYLRGIQSEINDLHRDGRLKAWDRSRLHDLIRCVVDGVQGRVGLERALRGEVSTTAERSASALDRVRDARRDDEVPRLVVDWTEDGQGIVLDTSTYPGRVVGTHSEPAPPRDARGDAEAIKICAREHECVCEALRALIDQTPGSHPLYQASLDALLGGAGRSPQGEDHEAGIETATQVIFGPRTSAAARQLVGEAVAAYLECVSAPKADENQENDRHA
jgi:hypothetical protein